jgi:hypothetical protein
MRHFAGVIALWSALLSGCGTAAVRGATNFGPAAASGFVSIVRLTFASDKNGSLIEVTVVTLLEPGGAQELTFCGSQARQFPMNARVTTKYRQGATCATLISVRPISVTPGS